MIYGFSVLPRQVLYIILLKSVSQQLSKVLNLGPYVMWELSMLINRILTNKVRKTPISICSYCSLTIKSASHCCREMVAWTAGLYFTGLALDYGKTDPCAQKEK